VGRNCYGGKKEIDLNDCLDSTDLAALEVCTREQGFAVSGDITFARGEGIGSNDGATIYCVMPG